MAFQRWPIFVDCPGCEMGMPVSYTREIPFEGVHLLQNRFPHPCNLMNEELVHVTEQFGRRVFAWLPVIKRNGTRAWMQWVERHSDGSFTGLDKDGQSAPPACQTEE